MAIATVRVVNWLSRTMNRGSGTVAGGRAGLAIAPDLLSDLATGRSVILVSGTNGKTTTTTMVAAGWGGPVATNDTGSNMAPGQVAALVASKSPHAALETDEAWLSEMMRQTRPRVVVLLNLSRDQLDRANEVRQMAERWRRALEATEHGDLVVVANANDPLVVYAARGAAHVRWCDVATAWVADAMSCPVCTLALSHESDSWHCSCGFTKPSTMTTALGEHLVVGGVEVDLALSMPGDFNRSNAAMAVTALVELGVDAREAVTRISALETVAGRFSLRYWGHHRVRLALAKNPAGFAAILSTVAPDSSPVWVAINARVADGHDPSWLYDVPFEVLRGHRVYCFGDRRLDLATRLDYAQVDYVIVDDESMVPVADEPVQLLANYTAFSDWLARTTP